MVGNVPQNANQPNPPPSWRDRTPLNLAPPLHALPQNDEKELPKFDPEKGISVDDHLQISYLDLELLSVEHEDLVCRLFLHTFEAKASTWYFSLQENSITYQNTFVRVFKSKFGSQ